MEWVDWSMVGIYVVWLGYMAWEAQKPYVTDAVFSDDLIPE
jgi:hypothetical protein